MFVQKSVFEQVPVWKIEMTENWKGWKATYLLLEDMKRLHEADSNEMQQTQNERRSDC